MKCNYCGNSKEYMLMTIGGKDKEIIFCPNHLVEYADDIITIKPLEGRCDCCHRKKSYEVTTHFGTYHLCYNHLIDFICHNLTYKSFFKLYKENIEGNCDFFLHSDFYWPKGYKLQPDEEYARGVKRIK